MKPFPSPRPFITRLKPGANERSTGCCKKLKCAVERWRIFSSWWMRGGPPSPQGEGARYNRRNDPSSSPRPTALQTRRKSFLHLAPWPRTLSLGRGLGCTAVELRKGTWLAAGQSQLRRSGIFVETSGSTMASSPVATVLNSFQVTLIQRQWGWGEGGRFPTTMSRCAVERRRSKIPLAGFGALVKVRPQ